MKTPELTDSIIRITELGLRQSAARLIPADSVLVVVRSGVLKHAVPVAINRVPVALNQDMKALQAGPRLDPEYLAHYLRAMTPVMLRWVRATTADNFPVEKLRELPLPLPPVSEQRRIADILGRTDTLRAKRQQGIAAVDALTQATFADCFGDAYTNPRKWPRATLGTLLVEPPQNGLYRPASDYGSGTPIVRIDSFYSGAVTDINALKRLRISAKDQKTYALTPDDVLINRVNNRPYLGKSALVPDLTEPTVFESNMMRFRVDSSLAEPRYIVAFLQTRFIRSQIDRAERML